MEISHSFIIITLVLIAIIAVIFYVLPPKYKSAKLSPLAGLSFGLILSGMFFGDERIISYSFIAAGVTLAIIDIYNKHKELKR